MFLPQQKRKVRGHQHPFAALILTKDHPVSNNIYQFKAYKFNENEKLGFEPTISAGGWPQTYAVERAAIGTGSKENIRNLN